MKMTSREFREYKWKIFATIVLILLITAIHYLTDPHAVAYHNVARRLYYLPIVVAAFALGIRGGFFTAFVVTLAYVPHAFFMTHHDPAPGIDKALEIILYFVVGGLTGILADRERRLRFDLETSLEERKILQSQLIQAGKMSALGELSSGLAHEIRNPLAAILGSAEALSSEFGKSHKKRRMADLLLREIDRLNGVVSRFLSFAKPAKPKRETFEIHALFNSTLALLPDARRCHIEPFEDTLGLEVDVNQIQQVLLNLALNGLSSSEDADIFFSANYRVINGLNYITLFVRDTGKGVDENLLMTLFDPFVTGREEGTGLGLSISSQIMDAHRGYIDFSTSDKGSEFRLNFPIDEDKI